MIFEIGKLYTVNEVITFGFGDKIKPTSHTVDIVPDDCLLFLFTETIKADIIVNWIHFLYDNKIIFRSTSHYDKEWFKEINENV